MTKTLEKAFETAAQLPTEAQEELAQHLLNEIKELEWDKKLANSTDLLHELAKDAIADFRSGKTSQEDW